MGLSKTCFWVTMALCVTVGCCEELKKKVGETVTMNCGNEAPSADIEWKHNNVLVIRKIGKTGRLIKGQTNLGKNAKLIGNNLIISSISNDDFGDYTCNTVQHKLFVASAFASPSHVLVSTEAKLRCDIKGMTAQFKWTRPNKSQYGTDKDVTLKAVRSNDTGHWSCQIMANGKEIMMLGVNLTVVGPLTTTKEIRVNPGSDAMLPCILPNLGSLSIVEAGWTRDPPTDLHLKTTSTSDLKWNSTSDFKSKFTLSDKPLSTVFNVTIKKVEHADSGMYVCTLVFKGGKNLNATLNVVVEGERVSDPKVKSANNGKGILQKSVLGVGLWVWIAVGGSSLLLIVLVVVIVLMHRRNKRIKRQIRKIKSTRKSLEPRNYCQCDRPVKQPRAGKGVRPPPLSRQHYNALTD